MVENQIQGRDVTLQPVRLLLSILSSISLCVTSLFIQCFFVENMEGFWKPGEAPPGVDDRDNEGEGGAVVVWNPNATLSVQKQRLSLPVFQQRSELLFCVQQHRVCIVVGATGSGKTTQIPQFLLEQKFDQGRLVGITQPRRIAAISVAQRVAEEMGTKLGGKVGYNVRFDNCSSEETRILFLTDGVLMRELILDPLLSRYSVIMIDEAHERTIHSDLLFALVKKILLVRLDLRLIISSATIDAGEFKTYFTLPGGADGAPPIEPVITSVSGRQFPVDIHYLKEACSDYVVQVKRQKEKRREKFVLKKKDCLNGLFVASIGASW